MKVALGKKEVRDVAIHHLAGVGPDDAERLALKVNDVFVGRLAGTARDERRDEQEEAEAEPWGDGSLHFHSFHPFSLAGRWALALGERKVAAAWRGGAKGGGKSCVSWFVRREDGRR